ncbi:MAG: adenylate/guanylate cyclase domain-containing protein [Leptospirales bacterium]
MNNDKQDDKNNIRYYIPGSVIKQLAESKSKLKRTENFRGGVLFFDLVQFTGLTRSLAESGPRGAEKLHEIMTSYYGLMIDIIYRYGGSVYQFAGDSALAAFEENDNEVDLNLIICACAIEMKNALKNSGLKYENNSIQSKFALSYGDFYQVLLGDDKTFYQVALLGSAIDRAVQAEAFANPGEIILAPEVADAIAEQGRTEQNGNNYILHELNTEVKVPPLKAIETIENEELFLKKCAKFVSPVLIEKINTGQHSYIGEFRDVTTVFLQLDGLDYSKNIKNSIDLLNSFYSHTRKLCDNYGGTLIQTDFTDKGNVFLILFGAPIAQEKKEAMAVRFALRLIETRSQFSFIKNLNVGISTGPLYAGDVGSKRRKGYSVLGESVNLSARLMQHPAEGQIVVNEKTARALPKTFAYKELEGVSLKGISTDIKAYSIQGETETTSETVDHSALVGRKTELAWLKTHLDKSVNGSSTVGLVGDAGVGKTRLTYDFLMEARSENFDILTGICYSYEKFTPYYTWRPIWYKIFNIKEADSTETVLQKIGEVLATLSDVPDIWAAAFARLAGETVEEDSFISGMDPKKRSEQIFEITGKIIKQLTTESKEVLLFEDYHWIDEASENLVHYLIQLAIPGLMLLLVSRPEGPIYHLDQNDKYEQLSLEEFSEPDAKEYLRLKMNITGNSSGSDKLEKEILTRASGNPFFLESIVYSLKEQGILVPGDNGSNKLEQKGREIEIPDSLQGVLLSRIDRLGESEKEVLKNASVIGRLFAYNLLSHITPNELEDELPTFLAHLEKKDFTLMESNEPLSYFFKHVLIRDVTYNSMLSATREALHNRLAIYLESLGEEKIKENIDHLAYHFFHAKNSEKSIEYSLAAARNAAELYSNADAIYHYQNIVDLIEKTNEHRDLLYDVKIELGHVYRQSGNFAEAIDIFQEPLEMVKDQRQLVKTNIGLGQAFQEQGDTDLAMLHLEKALSYLGAKVPKGRAIATLRTAGQLFKRFSLTVTPFFPLKASKNKANIIKRRVDIMESLAKIYFFSEVEKYGWANMVMVNLSDRLNDDKYAGRSYAALSLIYGALGLYSLVDKNISKSRLLAENSGDPITEAVYLQRTASVEMFRNKPQVWLEKLNKALPLFQKYGETWEKLVTMGTITGAQLYLGNIKEGLENNVATAKIAFAENAKQFQGWTLATGPLFSYILNLKEADACVTVINEGRAISLASKDMASYTACLRYICIILIEEDRAKDTLPYALELFEQLNKLNSIVPHCHAGYYHIILALDLAEKEGLLEQKKADKIRLASLASLKKLGKKYGLIQGYALRAQAKVYEKNQKLELARKKIEETVQWYEQSPNQWERALTFYDAALLHPGNNEQYLEKGIALCKEKEYTRTLGRLEQLHKNP